MWYACGKPIAFWTANMFCHLTVKNKFIAKNEAGCYMWDKYEGQNRIAKDWVKLVVSLTPVFCTVL